MTTITDIRIMHNNVSIAKLMGIKPIKGYSEHSNSTYYYYNNDEMEDYEALPSYNGSWGSLMPVVEQINKRDWVTILADECKIHALQVGEFPDIKIIHEGRPLIDTVYEAVVQYAKWIENNGI